MPNEWRKISPADPPEHVIVDTRIDDSRGPRNEALLFRQGSLWFLEDGSMYVYYTPTHFRDAPPGSNP
jgi:hypothetical protein